MTNPDPLPWLEDIRREAKLAMEFLGKRTLQQLEADELTIHAVTHALIVLGEAARCVSKELREKYADIPWRSMTGMRDRLIHGYRVVELGVVWDTITSDLPILLPRIEKMIEELQRGEP